MSGQQGRRNRGGGGAGNQPRGHNHGHNHNHSHGHSHGHGHSHSHNHHAAQEEDSEAKERQHWYDVMRAFLSYEDFLEMGLATRQQHLQLLPKEKYDRLPEVTFSKMAVLRDAARSNQEFFRDLVHFQYNHFYDFPKYPKKTDGPPIPLSQMHRNGAVLHSLVREWSADGAEERMQCFVPIIQQLLKHMLPSSPAASTGSSTNIATGMIDSTDPLYILVPGCGVGRLPVEIAGASDRFHVQANEFSVYMILAANFMLNGMDAALQHSIYPWVDKVCNVMHASDPSTPARIPDCTANDIISGCNRAMYTSGSNSGSSSTSSSNSSSSATSDSSKPPPPPPPHETATSAATSADDCPAAAADCGGPARHHDDENKRMQQGLNLPRFSFNAGDFVQLFNIPKHRSQWDGIVTCFFIDTAPVVLDYIETIHNMLKPGGIWVNMGPLLYHWVAEGTADTDERYSKSVELSYEEVKHVVQGYGFEYVHEELNRPCLYASDKRSLMHTQYNTVLFTVRKL